LVVGLLSLSSLLTGIEGRRSKVEVKICSLADFYAASGLKRVDVVICTIVVWPQPFVEEWEEANTLPCGTISISIKDPSWKLNLVKFYRDELFL
jgi:hypothetical protein